MLRAGDGEGDDDVLGGTLEYVHTLPRATQR